MMASKSLQDITNVDGNKALSEKEQTCSDSDGASPAHKSSASSSSGKQGKTSRQDALAQLDFFLNDISETTEKVKKEEKKKLYSDSTNSALTEANLKLHHETSSKDLPRKWNSLHSVASVDNAAQTPQRHISYEDILSVKEDEATARPVMSGKDKMSLAEKRATYSFASISSQGSDNPAPNTYGLQRLNQLCDVLEQYEQSNKRASHIEVTKTRHRPLASGDSHTLKKRSGANRHPAQRHSASFAVPADKPPKRVKQGKSKPLKSKYLSTLLFPSTAKSTENLKVASYQTLDRIPQKVVVEKPSHSYAADDMALKRSPVETDVRRRNSSVKESVIKSSDYLGLDYTDVTDGCVVNQQALSNKPPSSDDTGTTVQSWSTRDSPSSSQSAENAENDGSKKFNVEERESRNTRRMTEWVMLQQVFPAPKVDSSLSLLGHLDAALSSGKEQKKSGYLSNLKVGAGRAKTTKKGENMFLPECEGAEFSGAFHAAHAMTNQLTLTLAPSEIDMLSSRMTAPVSPNFHCNQAIQIS